MTRSEVVGMVKMRFDVACVRERLRRYGIVYTVRAYDYGSHSEAIVSGIGEVTRERIGLVSSIEDIKPYTPLSGFATPEEWMEQIGKFTGNRKKWLYRVKVKEEKEEKETEERVIAWGNPCERCKIARGCDLRPNIVNPDRRDAYIICVDRQGRHKGKPDLYEWERPPAMKEGYLVYPTPCFDPYEDQRNERYGEERLEYPQTRVKRWMDEAEERYKRIKEIGQTIAKPSNSFEKTCKALAIVKKGKVNINDLSEPMDEVDQELRRYELARYHKNPRLERYYRYPLLEYLLRVEPKLSFYEDTLL